MSFSIDLPARPALECAHAAVLAKHRAHGRGVGDGLRSTRTTGYSDAAVGLDGHGYAGPNADFRIHARGDTSTNANADAVAHANGHTRTDGD